MKVNLTVARGPLVVRGGTLGCPKCYIVNTALQIFGDDYNKPKLYSGGN
jgi:hypothetical protein